MNAQGQKNAYSGPGVTYTPESPAEGSSLERTGLYIPG